MIRKIIGGVLLLCLIGAGVGYYMYQKPVDKISNLAVDEKINAEDLFQAFESNETTANERFLDKVVAVKGKIEKVSSEDGVTSVFLETGDMLASIMCQLEDTPSQIPKEGAEVTIKGICTGYLTDVVLVRSIII